MAKAKSSFVCQNCGHQSSKWMGRCNHCGEWNTFLEEVAHKSSGSKSSFKAKAVRLDEVQALNVNRIKFLDPELNRVLGGGLIPGTLVLFGGEPGIGKSTLMLQLAIQNAVLKTLYVSGEESAEQIKVRAERIASSFPERTVLLTETNIENILEQAEHQQPELLIIDSIQTLFTKELDSAPGSVAQIRECTNMLLKYGKTNNIPIFLIGHITKEGSLAGPKVLEHMVDTVLQFEGDRNHFYRIIRAVKNRFGSTNELGIYEMKNNGLEAVVNPSKLLMGVREGEFSGISIAANMEGVRPIFIETQALVSTSVYGNPQRSATGFDLRRLSMLLAVLEKKCGFKMGLLDVFLNITGGIKIEDPACDLAIIAALISSKEEIPIPNGTCFAGEVGLSGEIRAVQQVSNRISEAEKLGFKTIFVSKYNDFSTLKNSKINIIKVSKVEEVFQELFA